MESENKTQPASAPKAGGATGPTEGAKRRKVMIYSHVAYEAYKRIFVK